ncbi:MAG: hypothetical protein GZ085_11175 [Sulfuriferula multivorans]|uniref:Uncharacterized protein n=1 Tax=Sulfuriferula multivorans TaxID=1559896 RepID=A0A7C9TB74_9PROT|nr:hypothetical protein [Sulfuriferula multivorans]
MAVSNITLPKVPTTKDLLDTIQTMDSLSQEGFSQIAAIASLALLAMKTAAPNDTINIIQALRAIRGKAVDIENCINYEAEMVGGNYIDPDRREKLLADVSKAVEVRPVVCGLA